MSMGLIGACSDDGKKPVLKKAPNYTESFTFFEVGVNSRLSSDLTDSLEEALGDVAISRNNTVDLETGYSGFLKAHFPALDQLNQRLNTSSGARVEHKTVKLMFRYASRKDVSFDYVAFLFSGYTDRPALIRVRFKKDVMNIVETLKQKYGPAQNVDLAVDGAEAVYWRKNGDYLIFSQIPDRGGNPRYSIDIYFVKRLEALAAAQKIQREKVLKKQAEADKTAF